MLKKIVILTVVGSLLVTAVVSCKKEEKDNKPLLAGLLLLSQRTSTGGTTTGTVTQQRQVSSARGGASTAASAARTASARTAFNSDFNFKETAKRFAMMGADKLKGLKPKYKPLLRTGIPGSRMTAVTCTDAAGASCDSADASVTLNGTQNCGTSGTITLSSFKAAYSGATLDSVVITMDGGVSFQACKASVTDFTNYPLTVPTTTTSGAVSVKGTYTLNDSVSASGLVYTNIEKEDFTVNSTTDVVFTSGTSALKIENLVSKVDLTTSFDLAKFEYIVDTAGTSCVSSVCTTTQLSNAIGIKYPFTANGTMVVTGTVGGASAGVNLTLSNRTINVKYQCTKKITELVETDYAEGSTTCTYTIN